MKRSNYVYLAITNDKYELPIAVFLTLDELSSWNNRSKNACYTAISREDKDRKYNCIYKKVFIGDKNNEIEYKKRSSKIKNEHKRS